MQTAQGFLAAIDFAHRQSRHLVLARPVPIAWEAQCKQCLKGTYNLTTTQSFADLGVGEEMTEALAARGILTPFPSRRRPFPTRSQGEMCSAVARLAAARPSRSPSRWSPGWRQCSDVAADRSGARPHPGAGDPDRRGPRAARRRPPSEGHHHLRWRPAGPTGLSAAVGCRHRRRLPRPARRPDEATRHQPRLGPGHRRRRSRSHG